MNRRHFLRASSAVALLGLFSRSRLFSQISATPAPASPALPAGFAALRRNVGIFTARGGTIGWLASPDALAVVDTQFPDTAATCLAGIPQRGARRIDVLVNTHHHGDHTAGNPVFRPVVEKIVAHKNAPALQRAAAARATPPALDRQVYADTLFDDTWKLELGGARSGSETLHARHFGPAHTGGDIIVLFEKANIVHMGDLVFNRIHPVIDRVGGASIANWITVLESAAKTYPADAIYIFGHGNPAPRFGVTGKRGDLLAMRDYLTALLDYTRRQIAAGKKREEIVTAQNLPGFDDYHDPRSNRLPAGLGVAYDELAITASAG